MCIFPLVLSQAHSVSSNLRVNSTLAMYRAAARATGGGAPQPAGSTPDARRIALDGQAYTWPQYVEHYGDNARRYWDYAEEAASIHNVSLDIYTIEERTPHEDPEEKSSTSGVVQPAAPFPGDPEERISASCAVQPAAPLPEDPEERICTSGSVLPAAPLPEDLEEKSSTSGAVQPAAPLPEDPEEKSSTSGAVQLVAPLPEVPEEKISTSGAVQPAAPLPEDPEEKSSTSGVVQPAAPFPGDPEERISTSGSFQRVAPLPEDPEEKSSTSGAVQPVAPLPVGTQHEEAVLVLVLPSVCNFQEMQAMRPVQGMGGKVACRKQRELRQVCLEKEVFEIDVTASWPEWRAVLRALPPQTQRAIIGNGITQVKFRLLESVQDSNYAKVDSGERHVFEILRVDTSAVHLHYHKDGSFDNPVYVDPIVMRQNAHSGASQPAEPFITLAWSPSQPNIGRREAVLALTVLLHACWNNGAGAVDITDGHAFDWRRFLRNDMGHPQIAAMELAKVFALRTADSGSPQLALCTTGTTWKTMDPTQTKIHRYTPPGLATTTLELAYGTTFLATTNTRTKLDAACTYPDLTFARLSGWPDHATWRHSTDRGTTVTAYETNRGI